jgi:hypothetical protein
LGFAKALLLEYPWFRFEPHPEWAALAPDDPSAPPADDASQPQATGIPGQVRIIYVPEKDVIAARGLGSRARYEATYFDPVTGAKASIGTIQADEAGAFQCRPPAGNNHDWVLLLENR